MNLYRMKKLHERSKPIIKAVVLKENIPALKTQLNSGFVIEKKVILLRFFNKEYCFKRGVK